MIYDKIAETDQCEFKQELETGKPKSWLKTVCAFANGHGGVIVFGVRNDRRIIGVPDPQQTIEDITRLIKARIDPVPEFQVNAPIESDCCLVELNVLEGDQTPYCYCSDGEYRAYMRIGSETGPASPMQLKALSMKGSKTHFDELVTEYDIETYSFDILKATYYDRLHKSFESEDFVSFGLATREGKLTNAGVLMADQWILRQNRIFCTRWNGLTKASSIKDALDDHEYEGCLLRLLNRGKDFVETHNEIGWTKTPDGRIEEPSYAPRAVEEAMVNALIHRDYLNGGAEVTIFVYDDRLEITSPGSKVDGPLPLEVDVTKITSQRRNPIIADLFQRLGFMERRRSGLRKNHKKMAHCVNYREEFLPLFVDDEHTFTAVLTNMNYHIISKTDQVDDQVTS